MNTPPLRPGSVARWHDTPPQIETAGARTWVARAWNAAASPMNTWCC